MCTKEIVIHTKAQEYRRLAKDQWPAPSRQKRRGLRQMAQMWHRLADEQDQGSELGSMPPFTADQTQPVVEQEQQVQPDDDKKE